MRSKALGECKNALSTLALIVPVLELSDELQTQRVPGDCLRTAPPRAETTRTTATLLDTRHVVHDSASYFAGLAGYGAVQQVTAVKNCSAAWTTAPPGVVC